MINIDVLLDLNWEKNILNIFKHFWTIEHETRFTFFFLHNTDTSTVFISRT